MGSGLDSLVRNLALVFFQRRVLMMHADFAVNSHT